MWNAQPGASARQLGVHSTFGRAPRHCQDRAPEHLARIEVHEGCCAGEVVPAQRGQATMGYTLIELMFVMVLSLTLGAVATPQLLAAVEAVRATGAVRYAAIKLEHARMEAIVRAADVGWQFIKGEDGYTYRPFVDGNHNGIRTREIQRGIDPPIGPAERLSNYFAGVDFGIIPGLPAIERGGTSPGTDPIKLGSSNILTFSPLGTSSSGSLYVRGRTGAQYVIRVLGETGRLRILKFDPRTQAWKPA